MHLKSLSVVNFKNYEEASLELSPKINCLVGNNGEGKTNVLDAIYYLSFCKSFFNPVDSQNILHDAGFFVIQGVFADSEKEDEVYCGLKKGQKKHFKKNKKEYKKLSEHIGQYPVVMISPSDAALILDGSETRRKFIDSIISQFNKEYLEVLIQYNKVLSHRNALLKEFSKNNSFNKDSLEIWDDQLVAHGEKIHEIRAAFVKDFLPIFQKYYQTISGQKEEVNLNYSSHLNDQKFKDKLEEVLKRDVLLEYTTAGIHKDDLEFKISEFPLKKYASQGQQKSFLIALKLAQFDYIKSKKDVTPILLLDDVYDKLDDTRVQELMNIISTDAFGQVFITDSHTSRLQKNFENIDIDNKHFEVKNGSISTLINEQA